MSEANASTGQGLLPVVPFLKIPERGDPYLEGHKCKDCGAVFLGERSVCSSCSARDRIEPVKLSNRCSAKSSPTPTSGRRNRLFER